MNILMLTGKEDEWNEVENINGIPLFENKLYSHVFKYGKDGHAYDDTSFPRRDVDFPYFIKCCNVKETTQMKQKAMISQPMANKTEQEITETRERAKNVLENLGYKFINTRFTDEWYSPESMKERGVENVPLCFLAKSLENMSKCHVAYFCKGWEDARGCRHEHDIAQAYGMTIIYEE